ncbi:MAG: hypothetical protein Q3M30_09210 [Candidatus Electrothrix sp. Rat3]|nr:hypothetical protein [Candidatus Electrothrix rattekaaiensis]
MHSITDNTTEFPKASFIPDYSADFIARHKQDIDTLVANGIRPVPERIATFRKISQTSQDGRYEKEKMDQAFIVAEGLASVNPGEPVDFDAGMPRLTAEAVAEALQNNLENRSWLQHALQRTAQRYSFSLSGDLVHDGESLLDFLTNKVSLWEADSFPLDAMMDLPNRYDWTFRSDAWSLQEQLRREARIIHTAWEELLRLSNKKGLFLILNQTTPTDYFCSALPQGVSFFRKDCDQSDQRILVSTQVKIASSEHREPLQGTCEGDAFEQAVGFALAAQRIPVLCDLSRRRFPRSFLRVVRFAQIKKWGIRPLGKLSDSSARSIPQAKSWSGFPVLTGHPELFLFDPWPISDARIVPDLPENIKNKFVKAPQTKPWQDDRIGARNEMELDKNGQYRPAAESWVLPVLGGWMRAHNLFKSRMSRLLRNTDPATNICWTNPSSTER